MFPEHFCAINILFFVILMFPYKKFKVLYDIKFQAFFSVYVEFHDPDPQKTC